jgi:DNA-binding CsgD family transcriptional regulator
LVTEREHQLREREKEVLRLLVQGYDVKACAGILGVSSNVVTERLREARRKLNASSSRQAARLFALTEDQVHSFSGNRFSGLDDKVSSMPTPVSPALQDRGGGETKSVVREYQAAFTAVPSDFGGLPYLPLRKPGETRNDLGYRERLVAIADLSVKLAAVVALVCLLAMLLNTTIS